MTGLHETRSHWYGWDAEKQRAYPCYEVPYADGNGMRPANLTDARKLGLMKSVTAVVGVLSRPGLEAWKGEQLIHSALTLPREQEPAEAWWGRCVAELGQGAHDGERVLFWAANNPRRFVSGHDEFAKLIVRDAKAQSEKSKEFGTAVHSLVEYELSPFKSLISFHDDRLENIRNKFNKWQASVIYQVYQTEAVVGSPAYGVAGKLDCKANTFFSGMTYIDFKTQKVKGKPKFYPEWLYQLAGYRLLDEGPESTSSLMSVVIDTETGEVTHKLWSQDEAKQGQAVFLMLNELWNIQGKYWYGKA